jgi:5-formyltetrahydrofolate cyclo-ligase
VSEAADSKADTRTRAREARRALTPRMRLSASAAIAERALELPEVAGARAVLAYAALPEEADPAALVVALRSRGARVALPRVCGPGTLALHWVDDDRELEPGHAGIPEPPASCDRASPDDFDLVLVPGVAFDVSCARLGFGGGFYDALLPTLPAHTATVALAFDEQVLDAVPCEAHDERVAIVVTPSRVFRRV